jgi:hypothetical protein
MVRFRMHSLIVSKKPGTNSSPSDPALHCLRWIASSFQMGALVGQDRVEHRLSRRKEDGRRLRPGRTGPVLAGAAEAPDPRVVTESSHDQHVPRDRIDRSDRRLRRPGR